MSDQNAICDAIRALLEDPAVRGSDELEHTLTAGYATALALEAERIRIERRIGQVAAMLSGPEGERRTHELTGLAERLSVADDDLTRLRGLLSSLKVRAAEARAA